jgi:polar amino acid transport system permease protein
VDTFDFGFLWDYWQTLLAGLVTSLELSVACILIGVPLGFLLSLARISRSRLLRFVTSTYVEIIRGTPVLILLFWVFFCLPLLLRIDIGTWTSSVLALSAFMAAVSSECFRGALKSIGRDQYDACEALGLSAWVRTLNVIAPQVFIRAIPTLLSSVVSLFKESALVSAVGMIDLMYVGQNISNSTGHPIEVLTAVALIYFVVGFALTRVVSRAEKRILSRIEG